MILENNSPSTVIGIDPSLCSTGIVVLNSQGILLESRLIKSFPEGLELKDRMGRIEKIVREIISIVENHQPITICIEGYSLRSTQGSVAPRIELGGLLRYAICRHCPRVIEVAPSTLKKWATGKGNSPGKTGVIAAMAIRYGVSFTSDDAYDSYALARMALMFEEFEAPFDKPQREAIEQITKLKVKKPAKRKKKFAEEE